METTITGLHRVYIGAILGVMGFFRVWELTMDNGRGSIATSCRAIRSPLEQVYDFGAPGYAPYASQTLLQVQG